ncbi:hypothetical protein HZA40_04765 [Candidatus Peregrinibacteria bacterium]|nr:hypothetical protein [Candidatus Peregrinibacteria bacterium]
MKKLLSIGRVLHAARSLSIGMIAGALFLFVACNKSADTTPAVQPDAKTAELQKQVKVQQNTSIKVDEKKADTTTSDDAAKKAADAKAAADAKKAAQQKADNDVVKKVEAYTGASYITLNDPKNEEHFNEDPVIFTGVVSPNTKKIVVKASTGSKDCGPNELCFSYNEDVYQLNDFNLGDSKFTYRAAEKWSNLWPGVDTFDFTATFWDATTSSTSVKIYYTPGGAEMGKPVIYLYPTKTTKVSVNVAPTNGISVSEPAIGRGWNVIADTAGRLLNLADNKTYPYLFWEGYAANFRTPSEGFVVAKADVKKLFEEKLAILGLNAKEIVDFEEYWLPKFDKKPYYFVTFISKADLDKYAPLTVSPKPDSVIRVFFDYKGLDARTSVVEQKLNKVTRNGFAVVEWGGRLYR